MHGPKGASEATRNARLLLNFHPNFLLNFLLNMRQSVEMDDPNLIACLYCMLQTMIRSAFHAPLFVVSMSIMKHDAFFPAQQKVPEAFSRESVNSNEDSKSNSNPLFQARSPIIDLQSRPEGWSCHWVCCWGGCVSRLMELLQDTIIHCSEAIFVFNMCYIWVLSTLA